MLGTDEHETDTKNWTSTNSASELTNPLVMGKKPIQAFESLNYDVRDKSQAQITILGQDEQETHAKNRTSTNFEWFDSDVRARSQAQITILGTEEL